MKQCWILDQTLPSRSALQLLTQFRSKLVRAVSWMRICLPRFLPLSPKGWLLRSHPTGPWVRSEARPGSPVDIARPWLEAVLHTRVLA